MLPMDKLTVTSARGSTESTVVFVLDGPITVFDCFEFQYMLQEEQSQSTIIDLSAVPYVDSTGVAVLVKAQTSRDKTGRKLALAGLGKRARTILELTRVIQIFKVFDTTALADAALNGSSIGVNAS
ncbi:MAG: hypothetical protein NVS9B15_08480 [Acidobacteriaceae bacterium]